MPILLDNPRGGGLYSIKEVILPSTITLIDNLSFQGCENLDVKYEGTSIEFKEIAGYANVLATHSVYCMGDGVTIEKA